jgi:hypothetical protein
MHAPIVLSKGDSTCLQLETRRDCLEHMLCYNAGGEIRTTLRHNDHAMVAQKP